MVVVDLLYLEFETVLQQHLVLLKLRAAFGHLKVIRVAAEVDVKNDGALAVGDVLHSELLGHCHLKTSRLEALQNQAVLFILSQILIYPFFRKRGTSVQFQVDR